VQPRGVAFGRPHEAAGTMLAAMHRSPTTPEAWSRIESIAVPGLRVRRPAGRGELSITKTSFVSRSKTRCRPTTWGVPRLFLVAFSTSSSEASTRCGFSSSEQAPVESSVGSLPIRCGPSVGKGSSSLSGSLRRGLHWGSAISGVRARSLSALGCDPNSIDPTTREGKLRLKSYIWADQLDRLDRLKAAISIARRVPASIERPMPQIGLTRGSIACVKPPRLSSSTPSSGSASGERARTGLREPSRRQEGKHDGTGHWRDLHLEPAGETAELRLTFWPGGDETSWPRSGYNARPVTWQRESD
jgi:Uncharacterized protein conserved in bacteria (DUF2332)